MTLTRFTSGLLAAVALAIPLSIAAQEQTSSKARPGWPCGGRLDPSYLDAAEATGGHLLMVAPSEVDGGPVLAALDQHSETIFRLAGPMNPGVHEFRVPIDS